jgi:ferredoxin
VYRIEIDRTLCSGFGSCIAVAPELIQLGGDGLAAARGEATDAAAALEAERSCPMAAITVVDEQDALAA